MSADAAAALCPLQLCKRPLAASARVSRCHVTPSPQPCRTVPTADQARLVSEQLRRQQQPGQPLLVLGQPQRTEIVEREVGPVVVRVLNAQQPSQASQSARDFLQQRLQAGVKRSAEMLKPVRPMQPTAHVQLQTAPAPKRRR